MTALKKYQRLESQGIWREAPGTQRRDVIVSFREASLIISDSRSDTPLSHWSLPAINRWNPGEFPALYRPGPDAEEELEIDDREMIDALETVHDAVEARLPHPGRMRNWLLGGTLAAIAAVLIFWMPGALIDHTAQVVPWAKRKDIGREVLVDLERVTGTPCNQPQARRILNRLTLRLFDNGAPLVEVLRDTPVPAAHLPGGILVVDRKLIEDRQGPDVLAGYLVAEAMRAKAEDPLLPLLQWAGLRASFSLLTTGNLPKKAIDGYGEDLLRGAPVPLSPALLTERFRAAGVSMRPYIRASDPKGQGWAELVAANPAAAAPAPPALMSDDDWVALQGICSP